METGFFGDTGGRGVRQPCVPIDLPDEANQSDVVIRKFAGLEPNAQGKLMLSFVPVEGYASVAGIEVLPQ